MHYPSWFDDSFFAIIAKSLVNGEGYSAVFFDKSYPFHFGISVGPLVILPAALLMLIFGNQYWVGDLSNILIVWALLVVIFILSDRFIGKKKKWPWALFSLALVLLVSIGSYGNSNTDGLILWHLLMGEIPAFLCLIVAALFLFFDKLSQKDAIFGGLFLGCALMIKTVLGIEIAVLLVAYLLIISNKKDLSRQEKVRYFLLTICFALLPYAIFELVKISFLGWQKYSELQFQTRQFYLNNAAMFFSGRELEAKPLAYYLVRVASLRRFLYPAHEIFVYATFYVIFVAFRSRTAASKNQLYLAITLILCSVVHFFWWVGFSNGHYRYMVVGYCCYCVGLALLLQMINWRKVFKIDVAIVVVFVAMLFQSRQQEIIYFFVKGFAGADQRLVEQKQMVQAITDFQEQGVTIISYGNNSELEYLLPHSRNFRRSEEYLAGEIKGKVVLVNYYLNGITKPPMVIKINHDQYYGEVRQVPDDLLQKCSAEFLAAEDFSINWCSND